jgi:serine/threonine-protein kinase
MSDTERAAQAGSTDPSARIGAVVDRYTLVRILGQGGMGAVYEARHATLSRRFAVKFLLPALAANREILRRFENEAKAAGGLEHPNLAAVTDFGRAADGSPYIVMEFLQGEDCAKLLKRLGPLPVPRAVNIVAQACRGLAVAHNAGIVHRDLKPENLFLTDAGDGSDHVKVLDFGIAKLRASDASVITGTGATFGTAFYMSPEQARGAGEVDGRTDVWSMGVVLYELLTGRKPFVGEQFLQVIHQILSVEAPALPTLRPGLPAALVAVIERAMSKELATRIPSILALAEALAPFLSTGGNSGPIAAVSARAAGVAETAMTPATGIGVLGSAAPTPVGPGPSATGAPLARSAPSRAPLPAAEFTEPAVRFTARPDGPTGSPGEARKGSKAALYMAAAVAIAAAAGAAFFFGSRKSEAPVAAPAVEAAPQAPVPAAVAPAPAARAEPVAPAAVPPVTAPAAPAARVSEQSEHSERRPNKRTAPRPVAAPASAPAPEPTKPAPAAAPSPSRHPIEIEKGNPYGP